LPLFFVFDITWVPSWTLAVQPDAPPGVISTP